MNTLLAETLIAWIPPLIRRDQSLTLAYLKTVKALETDSRIGAIRHASATKPGARQIAGAALDDVLQGYLAARLAPYLLGRSWGIETKDKIRTLQRFF